MSTPIPYYLSDPDYYSSKDSNRKSHIQRIKELLYIDSLISMASVDGSYGITVGRQKTDD